MADIDFAQDSVPVVRKHDAAVGVQEHLKHRTRPQRGADDVGDSLWIMEAFYMSLHELSMALRPASADFRTFAAAMLAYCAFFPVSRFVEAFRTVTGICILRPCFEARVAVL